MIMTVLSMSCPPCYKRKNMFILFQGEKLKIEQDFSNAGVKCSIIIIFLFVKKR